MTAKQSRAIAKQSRSRRGKALYQQSLAGMGESISDAGSDAEGMEDDTTEASHKNTDFEDDIDNEEREQDDLTQEISYERSTQACVGDGIDGEGLGEGTSSSEVLAITTNSPRKRKRATMRQTSFRKPFHTASIHISLVLNRNTLQMRKRTTMTRTQSLAQQPLCVLGLSVLAPPAHTFEFHWIDWD